jgi:hypothetical protein
MNGRIHPEAYFRVKGSHWRWRTASVVGVGRICQEPDAASAVPQLRFVTQPVVLSRQLELKHRPW